MIGSEWISWSPKSNVKVATSGIPIWIGSSSDKGDLTVTERARQLNQSGRHVWFMLKLSRWQGSVSLRIFRHLTVLNHHLTRFH